MLEEQRQPARVIEVGMRQQDGVDFVRPRAGGQAILGLALAAALKHAGIHHNRRPLGANDIGRAGDFAAGSANELDFHGVNRRGSVGEELRDYCLSGFKCSRTDAGKAADDHFDGFGGRIDDAAKADFLGVEDALLDHEQQKVAHPFPELAAQQHERKRADLAALDQRRRFEQLVQRAQAAGHDDVGARVLHQHHFADEEILELDAFIDVGIRRLLVRQEDVQAVGRPADLVSAAVGRFHRAGAAAGERGKAGQGQFAAHFAGQFIVRMPRLEAGRAEHRHRRAELAQPLEAALEFGQ